ncbi:hypothetical protein L7F22_037412 [Adiantum nelumboides]|nr:hypothetical protein [Adiantum nelumboides]
MGNLKRQTLLLYICLSALCQEHKKKWEQYLPLNEYAYNNTVHSSTGKAPFEIVEGGKKVRPILHTKDKIFEADKTYVGDVPEQLPAEDQPEVEELDEILVPEQILAYKERKVKGKDGRRLKKYRGMGSLDAMTKGSDVRYLGDKSKLKIAQGVSGAVADKGSIMKLLPYTMHAVKQGFQDLGLRSIEAAHYALTVGQVGLEVRTGAAQAEGGVHHLVSYEKRSF